MLILITTIAILITVIFFLFVDGNSSNNKEDKAQVTQGVFITNREKEMFDLMEKALPKTHIFIQVSFSALLRSSDIAIRNKFNRLRTDYVVSDRDFNILAVIELDDRSHIGKEDRDRQRDKLLTDAGYKVLRYPKIPTARVIKRDIYR